MGINYHFFLSKLISENYRLAAQKRIGKHTGMKITFLWNVSLINLTAPCESATQWRVLHFVLLGNNYEAIQLGGMARGRYIVYIPLMEICPSSYSCCSSQKASGLQSGAFRLFSPSNSHFLSTQFNIWSTSISRSICTEAKLNILDSKISLIVPREYSFI